MWGSWNGVENEFVDDEELDGLRDGRRVPPTVRLETLASKRYPMEPPVANDRLTSHQRCVFGSAHWHGVVAKLLYTWVFVKLVNQLHGGTVTNHKRLSFSLGIGDSRCAIHFKLLFTPGDNVFLYFLRWSLAIVSHLASYRASVDFSLNSISIQGGYERKKLG